jgi:hypothetical protein
MQLCHHPVASAQETNFHVLAPRCGEDGRPAAVSLWDHDEAEKQFKAEMFISPGETKGFACLVVSI